MTQAQADNSSTLRECMGACMLRTPSPPTGGGGHHHQQEDEVTTTNRRRRWCGEKSTVRAVLPCATTVYTTILLARASNWAQGLLAAGSCPHLACCVQVVGHHCAALHDQHHVGQQHLLQLLVRQLLHTHKHSTAQHSMGQNTE